MMSFMARHHKGFGLAYQTHREEFHKLLGRTDASVTLANRMLETGDCRSAFHHLMDARAQMAQLTLHLTSSHGQGQEPPSFDVSEEGSLYNRVQDVQRKFPVRCLCAHRQKRGKHAKTP